MTEKELKQAQAQELVQTMASLSDTSMMAIANLINTAATLDKAVRELPPDFRMREETA